MDSDKTDFLDDDNRREEWDYRTLQRDFAVLGFWAPYVVVRRRSDGKVGSLRFDHYPTRVYYDWQEKI